MNAQRDTTVHSLLNLILKLHVQLELIEMNPKELNLVIVLNVLKGIIVQLLLLLLSHALKVITAQQELVNQVNVPRVHLEPQCICLKKLNVLIV